MPEGPEIRLMSRNLQPLVGNRLEKFEVLSGRYTKKPIVGIELPIGQTINSLEVKGKLMALHLEEHTVLSTAGMSGSWRAGEVEHKFARTHLKAGPSATFLDMRNFGTFRVLPTLVALEKLDELGPDIMETSLLPIDLWGRVLKFGKKQSVAEALLDQRIFCGVGNYIRADAMWLARINPTRRLSDLSQTELTTLWRHCFAVATDAFKLGAGYQDKVYRQLLSPTGGKVQSYTDGRKRTVWWSPTEQV